MKKLIKHKLLILVVVVFACFTAYAAVNKISLDSPVSYPTDI